MMMLQAADRYPVLLIFNTTIACIAKSGRVNCTIQTDSIANECFAQGRSGETAGVWLSSLLSTVVSFQPVCLTIARASPQTIIPVSPRGKTGISQTQARNRKDEIPAPRFAWPE